MINNEVEVKLAEGLQAEVDKARLQLRSVQNDRDVAVKSRSALINDCRRLEAEKKQSEGELEELKKAITEKQRLLSSLSGDFANAENEFKKLLTRQAAVRESIKSEEDTISKKIRELEQREEKIIEDESRILLLQVQNEKEVKQNAETAKKFKDFIETL